MSRMVARLQARRFARVVNAKTADVPADKISDAILLRADKVIE